MNAVASKIKAVFTAQPGNLHTEMRAAAFDGLAAVLASVAINAAYITVQVITGPHTSFTPWLHWTNAGMLAMVAIFATLLSMLAVTTSSSFPLRKQPTSRSAAATIFAVAAAVVLTTSLAMMASTTSDSFMKLAFETALTAGVTGIPAALRWTSPKAFAYRTDAAHNTV